MHVKESTSDVSRISMVIKLYKKLEIVIRNPNIRGGVTSGTPSQFMYTADHTYLDKLNKYSQHIFKPNHRFQPFVIEEFGAIHKEGMTVFNRLCEFIATRQNKDLITIKFHYSKLLSSTIHRQNSQVILSRS